MAKKARKEVYSQVEELETELDARRLELGVEEAATLKKDSRATVESAGQRKARALLWAHLLRFDLQDGALKGEQQRLLELAPPLLQSLANISQAHGWLKTSLLCLRLQAALAQALPVGYTLVAQLPGLEMEEAERVAVEGGFEGEAWLDKLVVGAEKETEKVGEKGEGAKLGTEAKEVAKGWHKLDLVSAEFKGES
jgi:translocation protein SEC63